MGYKSLYIIAHFPRKCKSFSEFSFGNFHKNSRFEMSSVVSVEILTERGYGRPHGDAPYGAHRPILSFFKVLVFLYESSLRTLNRDLFGVPQTQWAGTHGE